MSLKNVYTIYDTVAEQAGPPFVAVNDAVAVRNYRGVLQNVPKVDQDAYQLYLIGTWDEELMFLRPIDVDPNLVIVPILIDTMPKQIELDGGIPT